MIGTSQIGGCHLGGIFVTRHATLLTATDFLRSRLSQTIQPAPILEFFELETAEGNFVRVVDFADKDASATAGAVDFDGKTWTTITIARTAIEENVEGRSPLISLTIADPVRTYAAFLRQNNWLESAKVRYWRTTQDKITEPKLAVEAFFTVRSVSTRDGPASVTVRLGPPPLLDESYPRVPVSRWKCINDFQRKFTHGGFNHCSYWSDEFELPTEQTLEDNGPAAETAKFHGWFTLNADGAGTSTRFGLLAPAFSNDRELDAFEDKTDCRWLDANRNGLFVFKKIGLDSVEETTDVDFFAKFTSGDTSKPDNLIGLLVQSIDTPADWVFWGLWEQTIAGGFKHRARVTSSSTSTDTDLSDNGDNVFRIERDGDDWKLHSGSQTLDSLDLAEPSWTLRTTKTLSMSGPLRCGFVLASDDTVDTNPIEGRFFYLRALGGGYKKCPRDHASCDLRNNLAQFNGMLGLPDRVGQRAFV